MADTDYLGGPRHAPAPQITPMSQDQVGGTSRILNSAGQIAATQRGSRPAWCCAQHRRAVADRHREHPQERRPGPTYSGPEKRGRADE